MANTGRQSWFWMMVGIAWRFVALWILLFVLAVALGPVASVELLLIAVVAAVGAVVWSRLGRKRRAAEPA